MSIKSRLFLLLFIAALCVYGEYFRKSYLSEKTKLEQSKREYQTLSISFNDYKSKSRLTSDIDKQGQEALLNVKRENDNLRNQFRGGAIGVFINTVTAPEMRKPTAPCVANDARARLNDANQQDFFDLKERAEQSKIMIESLQQYINQVCLKENKQ